VVDVSEKASPARDSIRGGSVRTTRGRLRSELLARAKHARRIDSNLVLTSTGSAIGPLPATYC